MTTKLDTRPARGDLTSRECCKLLCGALAGAMIGLKAPIVRHIFEIMWMVGDSARKGSTTAEDVQRVASQLVGQYDPIEGLRVPPITALLSSVVAAIDDQAAPDAVATALDWIHERDDDFWEQLASGRPPALPMLSNS